MEKTHKDENGQARCHQKMAKNLTKKGKVTCGVCLTLMKKK